MAELAGEAFVTLVERGSPRFRAVWLAEQHAHGLSGAVVAEVETVQALLDLVAAGRGICLVPETAASSYPRPDLAYVTVGDAAPAVLSVVRADHADRDGVAEDVEAFVAAVRHGMSEGS